MKIGFIGLGIMGKPMAKNLIKAGYDLVVCINKEPMEELKAAGAETANSNVELAKQNDISITMLPNSPRLKR